MVARSESLVPNHGNVLPQLYVQRVALLLLLLPFVFGTLLQAQEVPIDPINTESSQPGDEEIEQRLAEIYAEIEGLNDVVVDSEAGVVTLGGQVLRGELSEEAEQLAQSVVGVVTVQNEIRRDSRLLQQIQPLIDKLSSIGESLIVSLPMFLLAALVVVFFWWLGGLIAGLLYLPKKWAPNLFVAELVRLFARLFFMLGGVMIAAELLGATALLVSVLGGLGVVGIALGFAIRDTVENFVASVLLSIRQPFGAGEHVVIDGNDGRIMRLTSRATIMLDLNGNHVRIPNSVVYKSTIINYSRNSKRRLQFEVGIDTDIQPLQAQNLAVETLLTIDGVLDDPSPQCLVQTLGDSNVVLRIYAWIDQTASDFSKTRSTCMAFVKHAFETANINMPEPIYRLRVENMDLDKPVRAVVTETEEQSIEDLRSSDLKPDTSIEEQVEQHRDGDDLLDQNAPRE